MNWVQYKDLLCFLCLCGLVVSSLSLTQEILASSPTLPFLYFFFLSLNSANSVKTFRENSNVHWDHILLFFCFHVVKPLMPILPLLPFLATLRKSRLLQSRQKDIRTGFEISGNFFCPRNKFLTHFYF